MVCTTITILEIPASIGLLDKGLTVDGINPAQCVALVGKAIGFYLKMTLVHTQNVSATVVVNFSSPTGNKVATYSSLFLNVGTYEYFLGYTAETYQIGTYSIGAVSITNPVNR